MKIGIITHPMRFNYGGILQAYALQTRLERMGHQVWIIRKSEVKEIPINPIIYTKRILKNVIKSILNLLGCSYKKELILQEYIFNKSFPFITSKTWPFVEKHIHSLMVDQKFVAPSDTFDCLVVGSDQIWRPKLIAAEKGKIEHCFLDFAEDWKIKRIAYAASLGVDYWEFSPKQTELCSRLIKKFDAVSVREKSSIKLCKDNFGTEPEWVIDPTMLLQTCDYKKIIKEDNIHNNLNGCLLYYILDPTEQKNKLTSDLARQKALCVYKMEGELHDLSTTTPLPSIGTWLNSIMTSDFVITDSFHGTVFSIIFNKPFYVMANKDRGNARIKSLLNMFGLGDRFLADTTLSIENRDINWEYVKKIMAKWQEKSNSFLMAALTK